MNARNERAPARPDAQKSELKEKLSDARSLYAQYFRGAEWKTKWLGQLSEEEEQELIGSNPALFLSRAEAEYQARLKEYLSHVKNSEGPLRERQEAAFEYAELIREKRRLMFMAGIGRVFKKWGLDVALKSAIQRTGEIISENKIISAVAGITVAVVGTAALYATIPAVAVTRYAGAVLIGGPVLFVARWIGLAESDADAKVRIEKGEIDIKSVGRRLANDRLIIKMLSTILGVGVGVSLRTGIKEFLVEQCKIDPKTIAIENFDLTAIGKALGTALSAGAATDAIASPLEPNSLKTGMTTEPGGRATTLGYDQLAQSEPGSFEFLKQLGKRLFETYMAPANEMQSSIDAKISVLSNDIKHLPYPQRMHIEDVARGLQSKVHHYHDFVDEQLRRIDTIRDVMKRTGRIYMTADEQNEILSIENHLREARGTLLSDTEKFIRNPVAYVAEVDRRTPLPRAKPILGMMMGERGSGVDLSQGNRVAGGAVALAGESGAGGDSAPKPVPEDGERDRPVRDGEGGDKPVRPRTSPPPAPEPESPPTPDEMEDAISNFKSDAKEAIEKYEGQLDDLGDEKVSKIDDMNDAGETAAEIKKFEKTFDAEEKKIKSLVKSLKNWADQREQELVKLEKNPVAFKKALDNFASQFKAQVGVIETELGRLQNLLDTGKLANNGAAQTGTAVAVSSLADTSGKGGEFQELAYAVDVPISPDDAFFIRQGAWNGFYERFFTNLLPDDFRSVYQQLQDNPRGQAIWRAMKAKLEYLKETQLSKELSTVLMNIEGKRPEEAGRMINGVLDKMQADSEMRQIASRLIADYEKGKNVLADFIQVDKPPFVEASYSGGSDAGLLTLANTEGQFIELAGHAVPEFKSYDEFQQFISDYAAQATKRIRQAFGSMGGGIDGGFGSVVTESARDAMERKVERAIRNIAEVARGATHVSDIAPTLAEKDKLPNLKKFAEEIIKGIDAYEQQAFANPTIT